MRYTPVESVEPGNVLAKTIFTNDGRPLLNKDTQLTVGMIATLRRVGVSALYVQDALLKDVVFEEAVSEETRREALQSLSATVHSVQSGKEYSTKMISQAVSTIVDELLKNKKVLVNLMDIRTKDNAEFIHALNVCIYSSVIGVNLHLPPAQLHDLALGALFHDIGKVQVPTKELKEEDFTIPKTVEHRGILMDAPLEAGIRLPDDPEVWKHTWRGFRRLRKKNEYSIPMAHIALQHHEHIDGSGYPRGLKGAEIHRNAKIVAIANFYDNLVSGYFGTAYKPYEACEMLMGYANKWFEHEYVIEFLRSIAVYPIGTSLRLTNGQIGIVTDLHKGLPTRPIVRIIKRSQKEEEGPTSTEIDLANHPTVFIAEVFG